MEESNQSGDMAISGEHDNAQQEYAMRRRRRRLTDCPGALTNVRMLDRIGEISEVFFYIKSIGVTRASNSAKA